MWDERYSAEGYAYGKQPNDFLREQAAQLPGKHVLCLAEGEGRNAVYLAQQGYDVVAVDASVMGMKKARKLAAEMGVTIETHVANLADFEIEAHGWDAIVSIFCHLPPPLRRSLHRQVVRGLRPGGVFLLEAYTPRQLLHKTGGPPVEELTMTLDQLVQEIQGLDIVYGQELEREVHEGQYHNGLGAVVQLLAIKS